MSTNPVKTTVDLPNQLYRRVERWRGATAQELGVTRVTLRELVLALLEELLAEDGSEFIPKGQLQKAIRARIAATRAVSVPAATTEKEATGP